MAGPRARRHPHRRGGRPIPAARMMAGPRARRPSPFPGTPRRRTAVSACWSGRTPAASSRRIARAAERPVHSRGTRDL